MSEAGANRESDKCDPQKIIIFLALVFGCLLMPVSSAKSTDPQHAFKLGVTTNSFDDLNSFDTAIGRQAVPAH